MSKTKFKFTKLQSAWLEYLKSGRFRQTTGQLASRDDSKHVSYCCLGVACVTMRDHGIKIDKVVTLDGVNFDGDDGVLTLRLWKELGLNSAYGRFKKKIDNDYTDLTDLNDDGWTHKEIAEYIEAHPTNVFSS